ncbi:MAG TPA: Gfo/Idh/MocA family oxidoreductase [Candidatus Hydrogenedentes bacterium]|nr:Gfo/Idh/MocA family oxidoreductase [Candidatus Hydrogenedentota bacterium]HOL76821.1 Gfo/Idh/MocA family oxidoreductase [Candidatus Hydrogenedentota bacterium]HPO86237.1 Gfo/Idh/MocA family oxidoreductase [Candidatus Hydrogenedentota bacterium]
MAEKFKLGFIGAGFIARFQAVALRMVRDAELAGVCALKGAEELAAFAKETGVGDCKVFPNIAELCNHCDAVAVFVPNYVRLDIIGAVVDAVKKGANLKGIICEKPLGRTVAEAKEIVRLGQDAGVPTAYFENQIHMKTVKAALKQLERVQRAMGPLSLVRSSEEHGGPHEPWFWDPTRQGGGVLSDMACHSIAVNWFALTPPEKPINFMKPVAVNAETALLKWGQPVYRKQLLERTGVDYAKTPAEDFATGIVTFQNPETGQKVKGQFTNSWMFDKQGLRLYMDGLGPGYAFEINSLRSPLEIFIADAAAEAVANAEQALEKATATRGLLPVQPNEADLYGYVDELEDAVASFRAGRDAKLTWEYGCEITKLCQAAYMSAERKKTIDLTDPEVQKELDHYTSLIAQGKGAEVLL